MIKEKNPVFIIKTSLGDIFVELFINDAPVTVNNFMGLALGTKEFKDSATDEIIKKPFYDGLVFHRVIKDFMIQGGCPQKNGQGGPGYNFIDEIDASGLGLDKIQAVDPQKGPHIYLAINEKLQYQQFILGPVLKELNISTQEEFDKQKDEIEKKIMALSVQGVLESTGYKYSEKGSAHMPKRGYLAMANSGPNTNGSQFFITLIDADWLTGKHTVFGKIVNDSMNVVDKIGSIAVDEGNIPQEEIKIISIVEQSS